MIECVQCGSVIDEEPNTPIEIRRPCPKCGSLNRLNEKTLSSSIPVYGGVKFKARHGGNGKPFVEGKVLNEIYRKTNKLVKRALRIDRDNDKYSESVVDPETNEIIHECNEPLSEHRGHGSAKSKKK